jgi:hypothetical protein
MYSGIDDNGLKTHPCHSKQHKNQCRYPENWVPYYIQLVTGKETKSTPMRLTGSKVVPVKSSLTWR